jgi:4-alpha-glucanotransferase
VDYEQATALKWPLLREASQRFATDASDKWHSQFTQFCEQQHWWLDEYALFMALRDAFHETAWNTWDPALARREPVALQTWATRLAQAVLLHEHLQFFFFTQWAQLRAYANQRGVHIIGDIPIYVGFDSAEVWAHPELFVLDPSTLEPSVVAGVPPDLFSETGQRWGNPLYRWDDGNGQPVEAVYDWWVSRFRALFAFVDYVRVDHFRGFEAYWSIPVQEETAVNGQWIKGPGVRLFDKVSQVLGELPIIAEDLGIITPEVDALRMQFNLPGMKVLQFAFGGDAQNPYLPHNYTDSRCVVYTGTHDNDTTCGWFHAASPECRAAILHYLGRSEPKEIHWEMIRLALGSIATLAIVPCQDLLGLGSEGRMNLPGTLQENWRWRYTSGALRPEIGARLAELTHIYGRDSQ